MTLFLHDQLLVVSYIWLCTVYQPTFIPPIIEKLYSEYFPPICPIEPKGHAGMNAYYYSYVLFFLFLFCLVPPEATQQRQAVQVPELLPCLHRLSLSTDPSVSPCREKR